MVIEKTIDSRINKLVTMKDFEKKYLKNVVVAYCASSSTTANMGKCCICGLTTTKEHKKKYRGGWVYGCTFGNFYNKRHNEQKAWRKVFYKTVCVKCVEKIESKLGFVLKKTFAK